MGNFFTKNKDSDFKCPKDYNQEDFLKIKSLYLKLNSNNASSQDSLFPPLDVYIRIPQNYVDIISNFNKLNNLKIKLISTNSSLSNNSSNNNISTGY